MMRSKSHFHRVECWETRLQFISQGQNSLKATSIEVRKEWPPAVRRRFLEVMATRVKFSQQAHANHVDNREASLTLRMAVLGTSHYSRLRLDVRERIGRCYAPALLPACRIHGGDHHTACVEQNAAPLGRQSDRVEHMSSEV